MALVTVAPGSATPTGGNTGSGYRSSHRTGRRLPVPPFGHVLPITRRRGCNPGISASGGRARPGWPCQGRDVQACCSGCVQKWTHIGHTQRNHARRNLAKEIVGITSASSSNSSTNACARTHHHGKHTQALSHTNTYRTAATVPSKSDDNHHPTETSALLPSPAPNWCQVAPSGDCWRRPWAETSM